MTRPTFEAADILRVHGDRLLDRYRSSFGFQQLKAFRAILRCRTAALGGHRDACPSCGHQAISYNSCRNRHCPKCQTQGRERWLAARERELLTTSYFHVVFTVPHELNVLALENPRLFYDLLFTASAQTLLEIAIDRKHLGAEIGVISILHTWGQNLLLHPHIHCAIPAGGLSPDYRQWIRPRYPFFLPVKVLSRVFRGKFLAGLRCTHAGVALSRPLHPSRGHLQSSLVELRPRARHFPLERLRPRWQARHDDTWRHRVLTTLLSARATERIRAHPSLRVPPQSLAHFPLGTIPTTAIQPSLHTRRDWNLQRSGGEFFSLALPTLRRGHDRGCQIYRCGIIHMRLLRFFVACASLLLLRCAPAHRRIRVPTPLRQVPTPLFAHTPAGTCRAINPRDTAFPVRRRLPNSRLGRELAFKSHGAPRPPQTPAASS